ncbi:hypothetical protein CDA63_12480 [Hymenobacter amundsenii]|uniref:DUF4097 domain-containing protein n=1 Tax=Hymenobacter amundsenii TaxID=2006685 RepID=A0A246FJJ3_9BACT|nr:DUF4097 family beta strand repeat-containing protein [Hymenobacter amundsenii]OWP62722.1 hypothetical protein CDA63_12480 [Hymenobacter amundsenii]
MPPAAMKIHLLALLLLTAGSVLAQKTPANNPVAKNMAVPASPAPAFTLSCATELPASPLQKIYCETRQLKLPAPPTGTALTVDARADGGINVRAWAGSDVRVRARITGRAATAETARALAAAVRVGTANNTLRAELANGSLDGWAVSYEVLVPAATDLILKAIAGSLTMENIQGVLRFENTTGNVRLSGVSGDVRGRTTNGELTLTLTGDTWMGPALDISTVNGNVIWQLPPAYAATLLARTTRGRVSAELNTKRLSVLPHSLAATLGKGGVQLKVSTVNGNVRVVQDHPPQLPADTIDAEE